MALNTGKDTAIRAVAGRLFQTGIQWAEKEYLQALTKAYIATLLSKGVIVNNYTKSTYVLLYRSVFV